MRIIKKVTFGTRNHPLNLQQTFVLESVIYQDNNVKPGLSVLKSRTRNKSIIKLKRKKVVSYKSNSILTYYQMKPQVQIKNVEKEIIRLDKK